MKRLSLEQMENLDAGKMSISCGLSLAGMVAATAGFAFVTAGAGAALALALISKGIATASVIDSCR